MPQTVLQFKIRSINYLSDVDLEKHLIGQIFFGWYTCQFKISYDADATSDSCLNVAESLSWFDAVLLWTSKFH